MVAMSMQRGDIYSARRVIFYEMLTGQKAVSTASNAHGYDYSSSTARHRFHRLPDSDWPKYQPASRPDAGQGCLSERFQDRRRVARVVSLVAADRLAAQA